MTFDLFFMFGRLGSELEKIFRVKNPNFVIFRSCFCSRAFNIRKNFNLSPPPKSNPGDGPVGYPWKSKFVFVEVG